MDYTWRYYYNPSDRLKQEENLLPFKVRSVVFTQQGISWWYLWIKFGSFSHISVAVAIVLINFLLVQFYNTSTINQYYRNKDNLQIHIIG